MAKGKILVTGGAGFIGSHAAEAFAKDGHPVTVLDNLSRAKLLKKDEHDELWVVRDQGKIALARCPVCKGRFRVLPCDVLPRKVYALPVIDLLAGEYNRGDRGLRPVAWSLLGEAPAHTTIRAWTEGLGAYALGRTNGEVSDALPASRVLAEVESRMPDLEAIRTQPVEVSPARYRSEARRTRLIACTRLIVLCTQLARSLRDVMADCPRGLASLNRLILIWCHASPIGFPTGLACTAMQHVASRFRGYRARCR